MQCVRLYVYACLLHERWVYVLCCVACMSLFFYIYNNAIQVSVLVFCHFIVCAKVKTSYRITVDLAARNGIVMLVRKHILIARRFNTYMYD